MATLISIQVAQPRTVTWQGEAVTTGIFKETVTGAVMARPHNLAGDQQADLKVHGGPDKAIYVYPVEHYTYWRAQLPTQAMPYGMFGENFTTAGLLEDAVHIGDCFRVGELEVQVTQPRFPCYKLGVKFERATMVKEFLASRRSGFYLAIVRAGHVAAGDDITRLSTDPQQATVADFVQAYAERRNSPALQRVLQSSAINEGWREHFRSYQTK